MFINISNHPSSKWGSKQTEAAKLLGGDILDIPFPAIDPHWDKERIIKESDWYISQIVALANVKVVHVMGEMCFTQQLVSNLLFTGYPVVASTTERKVLEQEDGTKISSFEFIQFRAY